MKKIYIILLTIIVSSQLNGQTVPENLQGKVSFVSSQNTYVKFQSTSGISAGDTLFILSDGKLIPVLKVNNLSTVSCVCTSISSQNVKIESQVVAKKKTFAIRTEEKQNVSTGKQTVLKRDSIVSVTPKYMPDKLTQKINGSISAYSYSGFSSTPSANSTQLRYNLTLNARNIANSRFSFENYMSFRHKLGAWSEVKSNLFNSLKIYSFAVRYDLNKSTQISLGRKVNQKISSIGAIDGLQVEKSFNKFSVGAVAGTRPDYTDYGFNSKLLQYGGYFSYSSVSADKYFESSVAFMEQMNSGKTDRRFAYFQLSNSFLKNIYFFSTFEVDLFKLKSDTLNIGTPQNTFNVTGLYLSLRYRTGKNLTLSASYDGRKNVMYYETYKTFIDRLLETQMRQSLRLQADYRITQNLMLSVQSGYRFLKSDPNPSKNVNGYLTYSQVPGLGVSITLSGTYLESNYLNSKILGATVTRDFFKGKLYTSLGYRYLDYRYTETVNNNSVQHIGEANISWQFAGKMSFSANWEGDFEKQSQYNMLYLQLRKRF